MIKVIVKNVKYKKEDQAKNLETQFEYEFEDKDYNLYRNEDIQDLIEITEDYILTDTGKSCIILDYDIVEIYDDKDTKEVIKERGRKKEFYVMHYNPETRRDSLNEKLEFKTYKQALTEFNKTKIRKQYGMVEIIFSPKDEDYSDNMKIAVKV